MIKIGMIGALLLPTLLGADPATQEATPSDNLTGSAMSVNSFDPVFLFVDWVKSASFASDRRDVPLKFDDQGWPADDFRVTFCYSGSGNKTGHAPDVSGTYQLSFDCLNPDVEIVLSKIDVKAPKLVKLGYDEATKRWSGTLTVPPEEGRTAAVQLTFKNTNGGVRNMRFIRPGYVPDTKEFVTKEFLNILAPFQGAFRPLSDQGKGTDAYPSIREWATRKNKPFYPTIETGEDGSFWQWELQIAVANALNRDLWICIPINATDDYVSSLARLIKDGETADGVVYPPLKPNLHLYVEYSNEVWNFGFHGQFHWNRIAAIHDVLSGNVTAIHTPSPVAPLKITQQSFFPPGYMLRYAGRAAEVSELFRKVFGDAAMMTRVRPVLCWQMNNGSSWLQIGNFIEQYYGTPSHYFYSMGSAEYLDPVGTSVDEMYAQTVAQLDKLSAEHWVQAVATVHAFGLRYLSYEGGGFNSYTKPAQQCQFDWLYDPRIKGLVARYWTDMFQAGSEGMAWAGLQGSARASSGGAWGIVEDINKPEESPRWLACKEISVLPRPPITAGIQLDKGKPVVFPCGDYKYNPTRIFPDWLKKDVSGASYLSNSPDDFIVALNTTQPGTWQITLTGSNNSPDAETLIETRLDGVSLEDMTMGKGKDPIKDADWAVDASPSVTVTLTPGLHALEFRHGSPAVAYGQLKLTPVAAPVTASTAPPLAPQRMETYPQKGRILLTWSAAATREIPLTGYNLYRGGKTGDLQLFKKSLPPDHINFFDTEVKDGEDYRYQVTGINANGESPRSPEALSEGPVQPPGVPTNVQVVTSAGPKPGTGQVKLTWQAPPGRVDYYVIYASEAPGIEAIANNVWLFMPGYQTEYTQLADGAWSSSGMTKKNFYYIVSAVNGAGEGPRTAEAHADLSGFVAAPAAPASPAEAPAHP